MQLKPKPVDAFLKLKLIALIPFLFVLFFGFYQINKTPEAVLGGNESAHFALLHSIVAGHTFELKIPRSDRSYHDGKYYSNKPPGFSFLLSPFYQMYVFSTLDFSKRGAYFFAKYFNVLLSALTTLLIFFLLRSFNLPWESVVIGTLASYAGTIYPAYSALANSIPLSVFLSFLSIMGIRLYYLFPKKKQFLLLAAAGSSYACIVDYSNGFFLAPLMALGFYLAIKRGTLAVGYLLILFFPFILLVFYNYKVFGDPFVLTYSFYTAPDYVPWQDVSHSLSARNILRGLPGFLFDPGRGLFVISPVAMVGCISLVSKMSVREPFFLLSSAMIGSSILLNASYALWHGGHCIGYRHILPAAIFLCLFCGFIMLSRIRLLKYVAILSLGVSLLTGIMSFYIQTNKDLLALTWKKEPEDIHAHFYSELLWPSLSSMLKKQENANPDLHSPLIPSAEADPSVHSNDTK